MNPASGRREFRSGEAARRTPAAARQASLSYSDNGRLSTPWREVIFLLTFIGLNLRAIVAHPRVRAEISVPLNNRRPRGPTCRSSFPGSVESSPLEDVVVDSPGVALGAQLAFCARVGGVRDGGSGLIASWGTVAFGGG